MFKKIIISILKFVVKITYRVKIEGAQHLEIENGYVLTPNHRSIWDVIVLYAMLGKELNFMAKAELFQNKLFASLLKKFGAFPVKRNTNDIGAVKQALQILNNGKILAIFPEGTRRAEVEVDNAKAGAVMFASRCQKPIIPVAIAGEYKLGSSITIVIGEPVYFSERKLSQDELNDNTMMVMRKIKELAESV